MKNELIISNIPVGQVYYSANLIIESYSGEKSSIEIEEWIVTKKVPLGIHLTQKIERITWGKRSKTNGDFGFLPGVNRIFKKFVAIDEELSDKDLYKTKIAAYRSVKPIIDKKVKELTRLQNKINKAIKVKK